ncbi:MAG: sulfatase-like hydrolase/transferase [Vicinamibacteria bacterium]|nr:sulfatase-like hydrolase/transferase [Vicinamibacteria bacterium]
MLDPGHYLPQAVFYEWHAAALLALPFLLLADRAERHGCPRLAAAAWQLHVGLAALLLLAGHADHELQRYMGVHLSLDFLRTYAGVDRQPAAIGAALGSDPGGPWSALWLALLAPAFALAAWRAPRALRLPPHRGRRAAFVAVVAIVTLAWPLLTWHVLPGGVLRREKVAPALILAAREVAAWVREPVPDHAGIERDVAAVRARWRRGDPAGAWRFGPDTFPLERFPATDCAPPPARRPSFVVIVLETMRARDMRRFNPRLDAQPTPFLDRLADDPESAWWPRYYTNGLPTVYAFMSLHTGLLPHTRKRVATSLAGLELDAFPAALRRAGYRAAFFTGSDPDWDSQRRWLRRWYDEVHFDPADREQDRRVFRRAAARVKELGRGGRPFLATVFSISNHLPFAPPEERFAAPPGASVAERLHGSMAYVDDVVREFHASLRGEPFFADTVFVVTGDHGYDLGDRGVASGHDNLRNESTWVPLIVHGADTRLPRGRQPAVASHVDLAPTLAELAGLCGPTSAFGHSLLARDPRAAEAWTIRGGNAAVATAEWSVFIEGLDHAEGRSWVYAAGDLLQQQPVTPEPSVVAELRAAARASRRVTDFAYDRNVVAAPVGGR